MNSQAVLLLKANGYNGDVLKIEAPTVDLSITKTAVTEPQSRERQDLLAKAATAGSRFHATGGEFLNSDDFFIAQERKTRTLKVKNLKAKKEEVDGKRALEAEAKTIIEDVQTKKGKDIYSEDGAKALTLSQLKVLYEWKHGKLPKAGQNKPKLLAIWNTNKHSMMDKIQWTAEEQSE